MSPYEFLGPGNVYFPKSIFSHRKGIKLPLGNVKCARGGDLSKKYSKPLSLNMVPVPTCTGPWTHTGLYLSMLL